MTTDSIHPIHIFAESVFQTDSIFLVNGVHKDSIC